MKPTKPPRPSLRVRTAARDLHYYINDNTGFLQGMANPQDQADFRNILVRHFTGFETALLSDANKHTAALSALVRRLAFGLKLAISEADGWIDAALEESPKLQAEHKKDLDLVRQILASLPAALREPAVPRHEEGAPS